MSTQTSVKVLFVGIDAQLADQLTQLMGSIQVRAIASSEDLLTFLDEPNACQFDIAFGSSTLLDITIQEVAQSVRGILKNIPFFYCSEGGSPDYDRADFIKNGFTEAFLLPLDTHVLRRKVEESICKIRNTPSFRSIKMNDIQPDVALGFDLYILLPQNNKYVRISSGEDAMSSAQIARLRAHQTSSAFVPLQQMQNFYDYSARNLKALSSSSEVGKISETERKERLEAAVRDLISGIFSTSDSSGFEEGKKMMAEASKIVETLIGKTDSGEWYSKILKSLGEGSDSYSHLSNVSTFAALFSMATGIGKVEDLAIAGLFHDLGLSAIPLSTQGKPVTAWTEEEKKIFEKHPEITVQILNQKKLIVSKEVQTLILQHHERFSGLGYPLGLGGTKLKPESQILGIADEFEEMTRLESGRPQMSPDAAIEKIQEHAGFDPKIISQLSKIFSMKRMAA